MDNFFTREEVYVPNYEMKKPHAFTIKEKGKKANELEVTRLGADIKIRCTNCDHVVMMSRHDFEKKLKKVL